MDRPLSESAVRRALADTERTHGSAAFLSLEAIIGAGFGAWVSATTPAGTPTQETVIRGILAAIVAFVLLVVLVFLWKLYRAPYLQRDEARGRALNWRLALREQTLEIIRAREDDPIDLPELMKLLSLQHGAPEANRIANEAIQELLAVAAIKHIRRDGAHGWVAFAKSGP
jgi:hypothetical protein